MSSIRLDRLLVDRALFESREKARRAVMAGIVFVGHERIDKPGTSVPSDSQIRVDGPREPFVSRAGRKLNEALQEFGLDPSGLVCMDVGASTGGFTDCLLQRGAARVYAIDVGYGQLVHRLRIDERVVVMERLNARYLEADAVPEVCDLVTMDLSFISLTKVIPAVLPHLRLGGSLATLVKPQFEAGRDLVGKGGIVRDQAVRSRVILETAAKIEEMGLQRVGLMDCITHGARGNREAFAVFEKLAMAEDLGSSELEPRSLHRQSPVR